jgi:hypothetical protein
MLCIRILHNPQLLSRPEMTKLREASRIISAFRLFNNICGTLLDYSGKLSPHNDNGHHASSYNSAGCTCILTAHISADGCCGLYYIASFAFFAEEWWPAAPPPPKQGERTSTSLHEYLFFFIAQQPETTKQRHYRSISRWRARVYTTAYTTARCVVLQSTKNLLDH